MISSNQLACLTLDGSTSDDNYNEYQSIDNANGDTDNIQTDICQRRTPRPTNRSTDPANNPKNERTDKHTRHPSSRPTNNATDRPTPKPTPNPTPQQTEYPTLQPTIIPTSRPSTTSLCEEIDYDFDLRNVASNGCELNGEECDAIKLFLSESRKNMLI